MQKVISVILALTLCLGLCACYSTKPLEGSSITAAPNDQNTPQSAFVGEWKANVLVGNSGNVREYAVAVIALHEDGTGTYQGRALSWELSADNAAIHFTLTADNISGSFKIQTVDGKTTLNYFQDTYYRASEFAENAGA